MSNKLLNHIIARCDLDGREVVAFKPFPHKDDAHLATVVIDLSRENGVPSFVVWTFNEASGGFFEGDYHGNNKDAIASFNKAR